MQKIMITGADGQTGRHLVQLFNENGYNVTGCNHQMLDITSEQEVINTVTKLKPDILINAAAYTAVDKAEDEESFAYQVNCSGAKHLAQAAYKTGCRFFHLSTDYVFDGEKEDAYIETDQPNPKNAYGRTKLAGETAVMEACPQALILRVSWVFSQHGNNFLKTMLRLTKERDEIRVVDDQKGGPTWAGHIAQVFLKLMQETSEDKASGIYHFSGSPWCSWYEFAQYIFNRAGHFNPAIEKTKLSPIPSSEFPVKAYRPKNSRLKSTQLKSLLKKDLSWYDSVDDVLKTLLFSVYDKR